MTILRFVHVLTILFMVVGVGNTVVPAWKAWLTEDLERRAMLLAEAQRNENQYLLPGMMLVAVSGYAWAAAADLNVITTGWLLALQILVAVNVFIFIPLMGIGLKRVRFLADEARDQGEMTEELQTSLNDNVPVVFGTLIALSVPFMAALPIFKPF